MRVLALSASFLVALGLAAPRAAHADPPPPAPDASAGTYVAGPAPYIAGQADVPGQGPDFAAQGILALPANDAATRIRHPFYIGLIGGVGWVNPNLRAGLSPEPFMGANLGFLAGYTIHQHFSVGFEFTTVERTVTRGSPIASFSVPLQPQAGCDKCVDSPQGGWVSKTTLFFGQLSPRVEYTPFGETGLFIGGTAGLAILQLVNTHAGFGGALRAGYRFRLAKILDLGVEAGAQGQAYDTGTVLMVTGSAVFRPHI